MKLYCDNKSVINIAHTPNQHGRIKHIKVDNYFIKEKPNSGLICTPYVPTQGQLADILSKELSSRNFELIESKLGMENTYSPGWGRVWENLYNVGMCIYFRNVFIRSYNYLISAVYVIDVIKGL